MLASLVVCLGGVRMCTWMARRPFRRDMGDVHGCRCPFVLVARPRFPVVSVCATALSWAVRGIGLDLHVRSRSVARRGVYFVTRRVGCARSLRVFQVGVVVGLGLRAARRAVVCCGRVVPV